MTRVDFYILQNQSAIDRLTFACRLAEKAVNQGNLISIMSENSEQSDQLDSLLWSFKPESFVPHTKFSEISSTENPDIKTPVVICTEKPAPDHHDVMINLQPGIPGQFSRFKRLIEIVIQEQSILNTTRQNYKFYSDRGYPIYHHKI